MQAQTKEYLILCTLQQEQTPTCYEFLDLRYRLKGYVLHLGFFLSLYMQSDYYDRKF